MFISIEGIEGSGKSTLAKSLSLHFKSLNKQVLSTREPGGTPIAESIRNLILHEHNNEKLLPKAELLLMYASRVQHFETVIKPAIKNNNIVICDRFNDASYAYQGGGREISFEEIDLINQFSLNSIAPDITLLLDIDVNMANLRTPHKAKDNIEQESNDFFEKVRKAYLLRADKNSDRIKIIDASMPTELILKTAINYIQENAKT